MKPQPTIAQIERRVRRAALAFDTIRLAKLKSCAAILHVERNATSLDPRQIGYINAAIHEGLHQAFRMELSLWGSMEEPVADAVERGLYEYVRNKPRLWAAWCALVDRKVEES